MSAPPVWCGCSQLLEPCPAINMLKMELLWWTSALSCTHQQCWPRSHSRPLRLSLQSQTVSTPQVPLLKPEFQQPATACTSRYTFQAGKCDNVTAISAGLSLPCLLASQHPHTPLKQSPGHSSSLLIPEDLLPEKGVVRVRESFLLYSSLPGHLFILISFSFFFLSLHPVGIFLSALVV